MRRVAILGAESTGKTTLAGQLQRAIGGVVVPEVLRAWVDAHSRTPEAHEQREIMRLQIEAENTICAEGKKTCFCDTTPLTIAVNSVLYFNDASLLPDASAHHRGYALTLLAMPDIKWVADGRQRDGIDLQARHHTLLIDTLHGHNIAFTEVSGSGEMRAARVSVDLQRDFCR